LNKKMRIALKAEVIADMVVTEPVIAKLWPYDFEIYKEQDKLWLKVSKPVKDYEEYLPKVIVSNGQRQIQIGKNDIFNDLLDWLQYIEAMGSFNIQIERIYWDRPTFCWITETEEEQLKIPVLEYTWTPQKARIPKRLTNSNLTNIVIYRRQLKDIYIPFTYFKEGQRFFNNFNYYFAYINFFMMLEYCFADGKFKTADVIKNFQKAKLLQMCILEFLTMNEMGMDNTLWAELEKECKRRNKDLDVEGLIYLFVMLRGELSHASTKSEKTYRDDNELRPFVVVICTICFLVCGHLQIYGFTRDDQRQKDLEENIVKYRVILNTRKQQGTCDKIAGHCKR